MLERLQDAYESVFNDDTRFLFDEAVGHLSYFLAYGLFLVLALVLFGLENAKAMLEDYLGFEPNELTVIEGGFGFQVPKLEYDPEDPNNEW